MTCPRCWLNELRPARTRAPVYVEGQLAVTLGGPSMADDFPRLLDEYVERRFREAG